MLHLTQWCNGASNQPNMQDPVVQQIHSKFVTASKFGCAVKQRRMAVIPANFPVFQPGDVVHVRGNYSFVVGKVVASGRKTTKIQSPYGWQGWIGNYDLDKHDGPIQEDIIFDKCLVCRTSPAVVSVWHQTNLCRCLCDACVTNMPSVLRQQCWCCQRTIDVLIFH